jgi:hypothetical protein
MQLKNPHDRANELHELITDARKQRNTTTAVGNTAEEVAIVGTNEEYMRLEIRKALFENEILAKSRTGNHAEENVIEEANLRNLTLIEIGASRPICLDCETILNEKEIKTQTAFSGKVSKNRRNL